MYISIVKDVMKETVLDIGNIDNIINTYRGNIFMGNMWDIYIHNSNLCDQPNVVEPGDEINECIAKDNEVVKCHKDKKKLWGEGKESKST